MLPNKHAFWACLFTIIAIMPVALLGIFKNADLTSLAVLVGAMTTPLGVYMGRKVGEMFARAKDGSSMADQVKAEAEAVVTAANGNGK